MSAMPTAMVKLNDSPGFRVIGPHSRPKTRLVGLASGIGRGPWSTPPDEIRNVDLVGSRFIDPFDVVGYAGDKYVLHPQEDCRSRTC